MKITTKLVAFLDDYEKGVDRETLTKRFEFYAPVRLSLFVAALVRMGVIEKRPYLPRRTQVATEKQRKARKTLSGAATVRNMPKAA